MSDDWQKTICILCSVNCGIEVKLEGRHIARVRGNRAHVASQRLRLREGAASRLLPERARSADLAAATQARRHLRRDRLGHRDSRGRGRLSPRARPMGRREHLLLRRRRPGKSSLRQLRRLDPQSAWIGFQLQRAGPGKDRRVLGGSYAVRDGRLAEATSRRRSRYSSARTRGSRMAFSARVRSCAISRPTRTARSS